MPARIDWELDLETFHSLTIHSLHFLSFESFQVFFCFFTLNIFFLFWLKLTKIINFILDFFWFDWNCCKIEVLDWTEELCWWLELLYEIGRFDFLKRPHEFLGENGQGKANETLHSRDFFWKRFARRRLLLLFSLTIHEYQQRCLIVTRSLKLRLRKS